MASRRPRRPARRTKPAGAPGRLSYYMLVGISLLVGIGLILSTCLVPQ